MTLISGLTKPIAQQKTRGNNSMAPTNRQLRSIQGFNEDEANKAQFMSDGDVDTYLSKASDDVLVCRERGRHLYPSVSKTGVRFTAVTDDGLLVRQVFCESCGLAERREFWETIGRGQNIRYVRLDTTVVYHQGPNGQTYLAPAGQGRMTPRMIQSAIVSQAMSGMSVAKVKAAAKAYKADEDQGELKKHA